MAHSTAADVVAALQAVADPERAQFNRRYFRTGPGEYGEGDQFLGCRVGDVRRTIKAFRLLPLDEVDALLDHPLHEVRLAGVLLLAERVPRADAAQRADVLSRYLAGLERGAIDNWDLVDASAAHVLGVLGDEALWTRLASGTLWQRRAAILATFPPLKAGDPGPSLRIAELLLDDPHDLLHKAVGWVLRDVGTRAGAPALLAFLDRWAPRMPRTTMRYALEKQPDDLRRHYLGLPRQKSDRK
ncbi:MAG: DNA alkylation repair protein [Microthrixaceae bacterium]|nr:DNA alkylation repair protein [Microthrixaceae bacterium]